MRLNAIVKARPCAAFIAAALAALSACSCNTSEKDIMLIDTQDTAVSSVQPRKWWHGKTAYQIYPASFQDSDGDGTGDLNGITSRLDYLKSLGVDIIWLSPVYATAGVDNGYDISDYYAINPKFGTMADFDRMLAGIKARGMHLIMDLVVNHCSSEHTLFKEALANPEGEAAKMFYFVKGKNGLPPDNLRSYFGGSVWERVPGRDNLFYLHYFAREQPDLNWNNQELRERVCRMVNWWLDKGVDGFRVDAIMNVAKDTSFPGLPPDDAGDGMAACAFMTAKLAHEVPDILSELNERCFKPHDALTVGEAFGLNEEILDKVYGPKGIFSTVFDFTAREVFEMFPGYYAYPEPDFNLYRDSNVKGQLESLKHGFICPILENHDEPRAVSFYLPESLRNARGARAMAVIFAMLRGLPFIYQGQELGVTDTAFSGMSEFRDLVAFTEYDKALSHGLSKEEALERVIFHSRDQARTPMLWDDGKNAGFSTGTPWIRLHQDAASLNAKTQERDPNSVLNTYRTLLELRKSPELNDCLTYGGFTALDTPDGVMAYVRSDDRISITVIGNLSETDFSVKVSGELRHRTPEAVLSGDTLTLAPGGAAIMVTPRGK